MCAPSLQSLTSDNLGISTSGVGVQVLSNEDNCIVVYASTSQTVVAVVAEVCKAVAIQRSIQVSKVVVAALVVGVRQRGSAYT